MNASRIYKCVVTVFIGLVLMSIGVVEIFTQVKASAGKKVTEMYAALMKSDTKMLASHLGPNASKEMQRIEEKFGPV
jgi:hypothetical protein